MASPTYKLISSVTVGSGGASSIDFTSIPSTYTDLVIKYSLRSNDNSAIDVRLQFNGSTANIYSERMIYGSGSTAASAATTGTYTNWSGAQDANNQTALVFASNEMYIPNYAGSNYKSFSVDAVQENNATSAASRLMAGLWSSSAAISSIKLFPDYGSFVEFSTAYLYGVKNV